MWEALMFFSGAPGSSSTDPNPITSLRRCVRGSGPGSGMRRSLSERMDVLVVPQELIASAGR